LTTETLSLSGQFVNLFQSYIIIVKPPSKQTILSGLVEVENSHEESNKVNNQGL